ncbi:MAG: hypothetical protein ACFE95_09560 [Candidatus Hodarchaeota archaeon]
MANFCSKCGGKVFEDSTFCEYCGSRLKAPNFTPKSAYPPSTGSTREPVYRSTTNGTPQSDIPQYSHTFYKPPSSGIKWSSLVAIFFIVILGFIAVAVLIGLIFIPISFTQIFNDYNYIGDKSFSIGDSVNATNLKLEIDNSVGPVSIIFANMTQLFESRISVYAKEGHTLEDANNFEGSYYNNIHSVSFDSSSESSWENPYTYELEITISTQVTASIDVEISTGSMDIIAHDATISDLILITSTGSITADFSEVFFNTSDTLSISTSTGSISTSFYNLNYSSNDVKWDIGASTGSIELDINQNIVNNNTRINYDVTASTGSIDCYYSLKSEIGLSLYAATSLGSISADGYSTDDSYSFASENFSNASMKFDLKLSSSTGSVTITSTS